MTTSKKIKTILIIEDETGIRQFVTSVMEFEGYCVIQAKDGSDGLESARKNRPDLILLDVKMPERDGWWVLDQVKNDAAISDIPVIIFTASVEAGVRAKASASGAVAFLAKPLSASELEEAVARVLKDVR